MQDQIYSSVAEAFPSSPRAWDLRARRGLESGAAPAAGDTEAEAAAVQAAVAVYEDAVQAVPSAEMFGLFAAFLRERLQGALEAEEAAAAGAAEQQGALQAHGVGLARRLLLVFVEVGRRGVWRSCRAVYASC